MKGLALGLNSFALGLRVDFLRAAATLSTRSAPGDAEDAEDGGEEEAGDRSSCCCSSCLGAGGGWKTEVRLALGYKNSVLST